MKEQVRNPSETDSIKSQISSKTSSGKKDSTKDAIKDTTSDNRVIAVSHTGGHRLV